MVDFWTWEHLREHYVRWRWSVYPIDGSFLCREIWAKGTDQLLESHEFANVRNTGPLHTEIRSW